MPVSCVVYGCTNRYKRDQTIHFFRFPLSNDELNQKWIAAIKRKQFTPTKWSRLCSDHFVNENYQVKLDNTKKVLLKEYAVPRVFSAFPSYYQKASKVPRKEPFVRNSIKIEDSNFNTAEENGILLVNDKVESSDEIVPTTNNKEVQTANTYTSELLLKKKIKILQQKLRRKDKKINNLQELLHD